MMFQSWPWWIAKALTVLGAVTLTALVSRAELNSRRRLIVLNYHPGRVQTISSDGYTLLLPECFLHSPDDGHESFDYDFFACHSVLNFGHLCSGTWRISVPWDNVPWDPPQPVDLSVVRSTRDEGKVSRYEFAGAEFN